MTAAKAFFEKCQRRVQENPCDGDPCERGQAICSWPGAVFEGVAMIRSTRHSPPSRFALGKTTSLLLAGALLASVAWLSPGAAAEKALAIPPPSADVLAGVAPLAGPRQSVVLAGGCFWGVQAVFRHTKGVLSAVSGYAGGQAGDAEYDRVSAGGTGHAEAVQVVFDPQQLSYAQLLQIYFSVAHDPTQLNRQFPDIGTQYRSAIFYQDSGQKRVAESYIAQLNAAKVFPARIVTQVNPLQGFYPAEKYHQNYATLHPQSGYIARFDLPKLDHLKTLMPAIYREQPVLVQP
jgi:peptide-methionine (S)-S-oxide reductase